MALLVVGLFVAATTIGNIGTTTAQVASGEYRDAVNLAHVRTAANDARANESLTLIQRGERRALPGRMEGQRHDGAGDAESGRGRLRPHQRLERVRHGAPADPRSRRWRTVGAGRRARDHAGGGRPTATFNAFDQQVTQERDAASTKAIDQLGALGGGTTVWAVLIAILSLIASWLIVRGIGQRIKEYR